MSFATIHTSYGLQRLAQAEATGTPINLTHMAVGDGNGNPVTPSELQTMLARELYRSTVNRVYQDASDPLVFVAELVVPASTGGFVVRECGIFDADGALFAVANLPETYKPTGAEGAFSDMVVRMVFKVLNAGVVSIQADPNIALASQAWVLNNITFAALIPGGTTGQVLRKASNADGDTEWADPTDANVVVDMIEEVQTLAAGQTTVNLATVTTNGLAVYIEGVRLRGDQWTEVDADTLTLATSYPAGTKLTAVQNEPAGTIIYPLARDLNLSDVPDAAAARTNLGVYSKAEVDQRAPAGLVGLFARSTAPSGWLKANGAAVSRTAYAGLFAAIGTTFGAGDGFNTFNLPDLRGEFLRGWDDGRGVDASRTFGSAQAEALKAHTHNAGIRSENTAPHVYGTETVPIGGRTDTTDGTSTIAAVTSSTGGAETRPRNVALLACIKF